MPARPLHVVLTVNAAWNIWNFRRALVQALVADGHRVTILAPADDTVPALQTLGAAFEPLAISPKGLNPIEGLSLYRAYLAAWRRLRPDCVLGFTIKPNVFAAMAAQRHAIPFVPNVTGLGTAFLSGGLLRFVAQSLYRRAFDRLPTVFFQNSDDRDLFISRHLVRPEQARLLPGSGIDTVYFSAQPMPQGAPVFLMVARLLRDKGVREYVEAARLVRAQHPEVEFQLLGEVGASNRSAIARAELDGWLREGVVRYLGTTEDVRPMMTAAHCVVLPSYREGAPRTLIEAAALGRPVIATDVPGCRAVLDDGKTGFLCAVRDAPALAAACNKLLALPHYARVAMGAAGRAKMVAEYDQALVIAAYRDMLAQLR
jgi:glycosyltransferase involved in cell wall biosynthesis